GVLGARRITRRQVIVRRKILRQARIALREAAVREPFTAAQRTLEHGVEQSAKRRVASGATYRRGGLRGASRRRWLRAQDPNGRAGRGRIGRHCLAGSPLVAAASRKGNGDRSDREQQAPQDGPPRGHRSPL